MSDSRDPMAAEKAAPPPKKKPRSRGAAEPVLRTHDRREVAPPTTKQGLLAFGVGALVGVPMALVLPMVGYAHAEPHPTGARLLLGLVLPFLGGLAMALGVPRIIDPTISTRKVDRVGTESDVVDPRAYWLKVSAIGLVAWSAGMAWLWF